MSARNKSRKRNLELRAESEQEDGHRDELQERGLISLKALSCSLARTLCVI